MMGRREGFSLNTGLNTLGWERGSLMRFSGPTQACGSALSLCPVSFQCPAVRMFFL